MSSVKRRMDELLVRRDQGGRYMLSIRQALGTMTCSTHTAALLKWMNRLGHSRTIARSSDHCNLVSLGTSQRQRALDNRYGFASQSLNQSNFQYPQCVRRLQVCGGNFNPGKSLPLPVHNLPVPVLRKVLHWHLH